MRNDHVSGLISEPHINLEHATSRDCTPGLGGSPPGNLPWEGIWKRVTVCKREYTQLCGLPHSPQEPCLAWPVTSLWSCYSPCSRGSEFSPMDNPLEDGPAGFLEDVSESRCKKQSKHTQPCGVLGTKCFMPLCMVTLFLLHGALFHSPSVLSSPCNLSGIVQSG